jgi:hypothetical protein
MTPAAGSPALFSRIVSRFSYTRGCTWRGEDAEPVSGTINKMLLVQIPQPKKPNIHMVFEGADQRQVIHILLFIVAGSGGGK